MRVLYVNHTGHISGAEAALLDLLSALPGEVEPFAASPPGPLSERLRALGLPVMEIPSTDASLRLHALHTPRALGQLARAGATVRRLAASLRVDVVHAHSIRAGISATIARGLRAPAPVVYVHDCLPRGRVAGLTRLVIGRDAATILANSRYTAARFATPSMRADLRVVTYGIDAARFDPGRIDRADARRRLELGERELALAVVGQITPWKGQDHAIRLLARLLPAHPELRLLLAGSAKFTSRATRYDNLSYARALRQMTESLGVRQKVLFLGERDDVPVLLRAADVALVPSWEEPFGRAVTEALAMEVPVVATDVGGPSEVIAEGEDGYLLPPTDLDLWAHSVSQLVSDPLLRTRMGKRGRTRVVQAFSMRGYVDAVLEAYRSVVCEGAGERIM